MLNTCITFSITMDLELCPKCKKGYLRPTDQKISDQEITETNV